MTRYVDCRREPGLGAIGARAGAARTGFAAVISGIKPILCQIFVSVAHWRGANDDDDDEQYRFAVAL